MDFSDFNKVTKGKPGPLMQKMKNQIEKYGPEKYFVWYDNYERFSPNLQISFRSVWL